MSETAKSMSKPQLRKVTGTYITSTDAVNSFRRFVTLSNGQQYVMRFSRTQRVEHLLLIITIIGLATTGFSQTYYSTQIGSTILGIVGGIDSARQVHHLFALLLGLQVLYHLAIALRDLFTHPRMSQIWVDEKDLLQVVQLIGYNLRLSKSRPRFDRYSFEQKFHYWIFALGIFILGSSGLMQLFPTVTARYLPGWVIPIARAFHHWQAILTVSILLTWHFYQNVLKGLNRSIFSGLMSFDEMKREHPLELLYLERSAAQINNTKWPRFISLETEDLMSHSVQTAQPEPEVEVVTEPQQDAVIETAEVASVVEAPAMEQQADLTELTADSTDSEDVQND